MLARLTLPLFGVLVITGITWGVILFNKPVLTPVGAPVTCEGDYIGHIHPPKEACSTVWVTVCSEFGAWASQCINGDVDAFEMELYMINLKTKCEMTQGCVWSPEGT